MIPWWIISMFFVLIKSTKVNSTDHLCSYIINHSDHTSDICLSNQCNQFVDPYSIMVTPNNCKTKLLYLSFSSYKKFNLFLDRIGWKLGKLFPSKLNNEIRQLRIYLNKIDYDDQPIHLNQLIRLGINIDLYELYIQNLTNQNYPPESVHYDPNNPEWFIIKVKFICNSLMIYNENSCPSQILSPPFFAPQRPLVTKQIIPVLNNFQGFSSSTEQSYQQNQRSIHLIIIILIPLLIILITIIVSLCVYTRVSGKRCLKRNLTITPRSSSIPSISNHLDSNNGKCRSNAQPYQISRLPSPHKDSIYKEPQRHL